MLWRTYFLMAWKAKLTCWLGDRFLGLSCGLPAAQINKRANIRQTGKRQSLNRRCFFCGCSHTQRNPTLQTNNLANLAKGEKFEHVIKTIKTCLTINLG